MCTKQYVIPRNLYPWFSSKKETISISVNDSVREQRVPAKEWMNHRREFPTKDKAGKTIPRTTPGANTLFTYYSLTASSDIDTLEVYRNKGTNYSGR